MTELYIGNKHTNSIYKGVKLVNKLYKGNKLIYHKFGNVYLTPMYSQQYNIDIYMSYDLVNFKKIIDNAEYLDNNDNIIMFRNGGSKNIIYTYDLKNFQTYTPPTTYQYSTSLKISNNNKFFMMDNYNSNKYFISNNGINWQKITSNITFSSFASVNIYYYNGYYYTSNSTKLLRSNNLVNWEEVLTLDMGEVFFLEFKGYFYVFCLSFNANNNVNNYYYRTNNGINWTTYRMPFAEHFSIRTNDNILFITTGQSFAPYGFNPGTYYSNDGINWVKTSEKTIVQDGLCNNNKYFVFQGTDKKIYLTENGINFTEISSVNSQIYPFVCLLDKYKTD